MDTSPSGPLSFLYSRKAWISIAVIIAVSVLFYMGKIDAERFTDVLKYVFTIWVGAMAVEKGAKAVGNKAPSSTVDTVVNTVVQTEEKEADQ